MKRSLCLFALAWSLTACGTAETPATPPPTAESAALIAYPTFLLPTLAPTDAPLALPTLTLPTSAGVDPETWVTYRNDQYGFSLSYPPCLGQIVEAAPSSRAAGLYMEGIDYRASSMITTTLNLGSGPISPDCVAQNMFIRVFELPTYSHYNRDTELTYDAAGDSWLINRGAGPAPDEDALVAGEGWQGRTFRDGDAGLLLTGLAVALEERNLVLEVSFSYDSIHGPPAQNVDAQTIDRMLRTLRLMP